MPIVKIFGTTSQFGEPLQRIDYFIHIDRSTCVFTCQPKTCVAGKFASTVAETGRVAGIALVAGFVDDCA